MNRFVFLLLWTALLPCLGQGASDDIPAGNPTQFPSGAATWTIAITYKNSGKADSSPNPAGLLQKIDLTQDTDIQRLVLTWASGKMTEQWHFAKERVTMSTDTTNGSPVCIPDYQKLKWLATGFESSAFDWVDRSNYVDTLSYQGKTCYHYKAQVRLGRDRVLLPADSKGPAFSDSFEAWIDKNSRLPVAFDDGIKLGVFTFAKDPPSIPLTPSPAITEAFKRNTAILMPVKKQ